MPISNVERQRRYQQRKRERVAASEDLLDSVTAKPFFEFVKDEGPRYDDDVAIYLEWAGMTPPKFEDDSDPELWEEADGPDRGSLGRAERLFGNLLTAATGLAMMLNRYKKQEVDLAIDKLSASLADPKARDAALDEIIKLRDLKARLDKRFRRDFPQFKIQEG